VTRPSHDPLIGVARLLIDGNNLLHAMRRSATPAPSAAIVGRLRAAIPADVTIELVFDGPPETGSRGRIAAGVRLWYAGSRSADALLVSLVEQAGPPPPGYEPTILVCTDDAELRRALLRRGAATVRTDWVIRRMERTTLAAPSVGARRSPTPPAPGSRDHGRSRSGASGSTGDDDERAGWSPGRGATTKKGNARREPKAARHRASRRSGPGC
jgi:rRNA-processing protein FCF1